jgi:hypothetical protein
MSSSTPRSQEEIRIEMKRRFDAVNQAATDRRQQRRGGPRSAIVEENSRTVKPEATEVPEVGENDSAAG